MKILNKKVKVSDYLMLSNIYSKLWLSERKPAFLLDRTIAGFWGAAGKIDLKLFEL